MALTELSRLLGTVAKGGSLAQAMGGSGGTLAGGTAGKMMGDVLNKPGTAAALSGGGDRGGMAGGVSRGLLGPTDTHKAMYMAVLSAALEKAHGSAFFNLETQINDLNVKLGNLRSAKPQMDSLHATIGQSSLLSSDLQKMLQKMGSAAADTMRHLKH